MNQSFADARRWFRNVTSGVESTRGKGRKVLPGLLALALGLGLSSRSGADILNFTAEIDGAQANICFGTGSPATGVGVFTLNTDSGDVVYSITFSGLLGTETVSHVHASASECINASPLYELPIGSPKNGVTVLTALQMQDMITGLHYVNIHSDRDPNGEIRGQILLVSPTVAFGLPHNPLGQVNQVFDQVTSLLTISNIGSSGEDGVLIDTGPAEGFLATVDFGPSGALPSGFELTMSEVCDGLDPLLVSCGSLFRITEVNGGNGLLSQDLSSLSFTPDTIDVVVFQDDVEVARVTHVAPFPPTLVEAAFGTTDGGYPVTIYHFLSSSFFSDPLARSLPHFTTWDTKGFDFMGLGVFTSINMTGGPVVLGNRIEVTNRAITTVGASYATAVRFKQKGSSTMVLGGEGVSFDGVVHGARGQARLRGVEILQVPHPRIANIGSSGLDGVIIRPRPYGLPKQVQMEPRAIDLSFESDDLGGTIQKYWWKAKATESIVGGDETIASVSLDFTGSDYNWVVTPPSPWLDVFTISVRIFNGETEVGFGAGLGAGTVATSFSPTKPGNYSFELLVDSSGSPTGVIHRVTWDAAQIIGITGQTPVVGDTIETEMVALTLLAGDPVDFEFDHLDFSVETLVGEIFLDILDEVVTWVDTCPADTNSDNTVNVTDLLELLAAWGPCPAPPASCIPDTDGNSIVNVTDLLTLLATWGQCP